MKHDEKAPDYLTIEIKHMDKSWGIIHAMPREFSTGSVGYFGVGKIFNPENPKARYQLGLNIALIGSKKKGLKPLRASLRLPVESEMKTAPSKT